METLPNVTQYSVYLDRICELTGISRTKARQAYGQFTIGEWEKEIMTVQIKKGLVPCTKLDSEPVIKLDNRNYWNKTRESKEWTFLQLLMKELHPKKSIYDVGDSLVIVNKRFRLYYTPQYNSIVCDKYNIKTQQSEWYLYDISKIKEQWTN